jgi:serine/threonine-protein kinase
MAGYGPVGGGSTGSGGCGTAIQGAFAAIYQSDPAVASGLGCPLAAAASSVTTAYQPFQNGMMIWVSSLGAQPQTAIYVLFNNHTYQRFNDTYQEGVDPNSSGAAAPEGMLEPVRGFGKVWRDNTSARDNLGWATSGESAGSAQIQVFERGEILTLSNTGQTYILMTGAPGTWSTR